MSCDLYIRRAAHLLELARYALRDICAQLYNIGVRYPEECPDYYLHLKEMKTFIKAKNLVEQRVKELEGAKAAAVANEDFRLAIECVVYAFYYLHLR